MHDIEPYYKWREYYIASEDEKSPYFGKQYDEFKFTQKIYNYYIHPQWDDFGSSTLYLKIIYVDYDSHFACLEFIGEWNDCLHNDIMYLKRNIIDPMIDEGIYNFVLLCDNILNFHASDDSYFEEWYDDIKDDGGWICLVNTLPHVLDELQSIKAQYYAHIGYKFSEFNWRKYLPMDLKEKIELKIRKMTKQLKPH